MLVVGFEQEAQRIALPQAPVVEIEAEPLVRLWNVIVSAGDLVQC